MSDIFLKKRTPEARDAYHQGYAAGKRDGTKDENKACAEIADHVAKEWGREQIAKVQLVAQSIEQAICDRMAEPDDVPKSAPFVGWVLKHKTEELILCPCGACPDSGCVIGFDSEDAAQQWLMGYDPPLNDFGPV